MLAGNFKMTPRSYINTLTITFCLTIGLSSCGQSQNKMVDQKLKNKNIQVDTSKTA